MESREKRPLAFVEEHCEFEVSYHRPHGEATRYVLGADLPGFLTDAEG
jgi:hypothetical protein